MEQLPVIESALILSIKIHPNNHAVFHARVCSATVFEIDRAIAALKRLNYIIQDNSGRLTLNEHAIKRVNTDLMHAEQKPTVHRVAESSPAVLPVTKSELVEASKMSDAFLLKPTADSLLQQLKEAGQRGTTASDMAKTYGCKGTSLVQILRKLRDDGKITKFGTQWFIATEADAVETIAVPYETRRAVTDVAELQNLIKLQKGWFTAKQSHDELSKAFIVDWALFYGVFMDMATEGEFNVRENGELVSYELSVDADNTHANCRWDFDAETFEKIVQDYIYLLGQGGTHRWNLNHMVEITKVRSDLLLHWFELAGFDIDNTDSIGPKAAPEFTQFDRLDSVAVLEFIGEEGCRAPAFMKAFNLDPESTEKVCSLLELVGIARYDAENKYLMLKQAKSDGLPPRVTTDNETGDEVIEMVQVPNEGFAFIKLHHDGSGRAVASQYQFGNSMFNGMPVTPTDDPDIFNLQVPEEFQSEPVNPEGMYERINTDQYDEPLLHKSSPTKGDFISKRFEDQAEEQKENPPERMYFNGEKPKVNTEMSQAAKDFVADLMAKVEEHIPPAGPSGPTGPVGPGSYRIVKEPEHSSMLRINNPMVGMHLFRVCESVVTGLLPLPEFVEDENSPYFGCKITASDDIGFATITVEPGHPMWQHVITQSRPGYDSSVGGGKTVEGADNSDDDLEAEEYAEKCAPHLDRVLHSIRGQKGAAQCEPKRERQYDDGSDLVSEASVGTSACGMPQRTVKPEWISGLAIIADQHKRSSATRQLLMEIQEYLKK